ncbi:hypothetical protein SEVIR_5G157800v4 [Setaria viridis]|uniref:DUF4220 domain-containing protein n=1 Tax=Setaria viridis TaxID=4556 RepID=A0A4U6UE11_SETVI|nr:uncharacterized protein LOC117855609 [Setaria viridis]TKW14281.1 hypothetical protein SEVIR_5G157800v2 [Setaria viridis]
MDDDFNIFGVTLTRKDVVNGGIIAAAVLSVSLVALSTYGRRRCRHPAVRFLVWGFSVVFLPLTSSIISFLLSSASKKKPCDKSLPKAELEECKPEIKDMWTVLLWTVLILTIKCNADVAAAAVTAAAASPAAGDVSIDGQRINSSPWELAFRYGWVGWLIVMCFPLAGWVESNRAVFVAFCALGPAKVALKLAAFWSASGSFALGKNARLIAGYMAQLVGDGDEQVPRYIVMGETKKLVEETAQGYRVKNDVLEDKLSSLVTLDRVWRLAEHGDGILAQRQELRDLCLSYSLFKLLRRRLSGYPLADAGSGEALDFVLRGMDSVGAGVNTDRVFRVLVDELWFASDFYYSPIPLCIFGGWCAALNYLCSVLIIVGAVAVGWIYLVKDNLISSTAYKVITVSLLLAVVLVEAWEIVAGVCSNWTKMALLGHYMRHEKSWRRSGCVHAALTAVLRLRPARRWRDKIGQNSVLEPRRFRRRTAGFLSEKSYGKAGLMRSIEVSPDVKDAVIRSLLNSYGRLSKDSGAATRRVGATVDWALYGTQKSLPWDSDGSSTTELILAWHVATRLFEMKSTSATPDMIAASHLSNYFAYLVAAAPELLPDCAEWSNKRYKEVSEDARAALGADSGGESAEGRYGRLVAALSEASRDTVLRRGAELGRHLVAQYTDDEASACRILADFWSEMALYVAPSENVKGHVQAMARGGEFITLVWALLLHAGVTTRPEPDMPGGGGAIP